MPRHKLARNCNILPWLSAKLDCREGRFIQIGNSLLLDGKFQAVSTGARILFLSMALESAGRREFIFPLSAAKKYGISPATFRRHVDELIAKDFIIRNSGACTREANKYTFSFAWKKAGEKQERGP